MKLSITINITNPMNPSTNKPIPQMIEVCLNSCGVGFLAIRMIRAQLPRDILRNWASIASWRSCTLSSKERVWSFSSDMVSPQGVPRDLWPSFNLSGNELRQISTDSKQTCASMVTWRQETHIRFSVFLEGQAMLKSRRRFANLQGNITRIETKALKVLRHVSKKSKRHTIR